MRTSIFIKLTVIFLTVLLPFYAMTLLLNVKGSQSIQKEITHSVNSRNAFYMQNLEQELNRLAQIFYEFMVDKDPMLIGISENLHSPDLQDKVKLLQKRLQMVLSSSTLVQKPMIYFPLMNKMISPNAVSDYDRLKDEMEIERLSSNVNPNHIFQLKDGRLFLSLSYPMNANFQRPPVFVVLLELSTERLKDSLRHIVSPQQGDFLLVHNSENWTLSHTQDEQILADMKALSHDKAFDSSPAGAGSVQLKNITYWESFIHSEQLNLSLFVYVPEQHVLGELRSYEKWVWVILVISIVAIVLLALTLYRIIHHPLRKLVSAFRKVEQGRFSPVVVTATRDEFHYLFSGFNRMVSQLNVLIHEVYEKEIHSQRSELKRLQAQINPHFLYNCFFIMGGLITDKEYNKAAAFNYYLRDYYRFITKNAEDLIPMKEELQHTQTYVDIQAICFGERIDIELESLPLHAENILVPRLIIQPIIENAFKYALAGHITQGQLWIHYDIQDEVMHIMVEDNGMGMEDVHIAALSAQLRATVIPQEEPTGLINVHRRLELMFGQHYGLSFRRSELGGLCVVIEIRL